MTFSTFTMCTYHFYVVPKHFHHPEIKALCPLSSYSSFPPSELLATTNLLSASVVLPISDTSCKWNHMLCDFLCLTSLIQHNAFEFQPSVAGLSTSSLYMAE